MLFVRIRRRCSGGYSSSSQVVVSPIPSLRQEAAAFSLLDSISRATSSALARADARDSMAKIASGAADAHSRWVGGTLESTLRMKWTMHRWYPACGSISPTVATSPAHLSPTTSLTPFRPRSIMDRMNRSRLALSSFMPSATPMTSRWPVSSTPMATSTLTFSTDPPHERLSPHTVHEHVRVLAPKRPVAPFVDLVVHLPELVGERLRGHPLAPQQLTDVVHAARADAGQIHVDQRLLDALLPPPVAFDHRRLEQGALELGHLESEPAGLDGEPARVVAGPVRLASIASLVSGGVGDQVGLLVEHRVGDLLDLVAHHGVELGLEHGLVELYDFLGHGPCLFPIAVFLC